MITKQYLITVQTSKDQPELGELIANRAWTIDGVEHAEIEEHVKATALPLDKLIADFNKLYGLPSHEVPTIWHATPEELDLHLENFYKIMKEELDEVDEIRKHLVAGQTNDKLTILTELADWFGDIIIYAASEMRKFGIPPELVLSIIMASNMSKLGENGKPIYDERGKVMKGPHYWKPEPQIRRALEALIRLHLRAQDMGT